MTTDTMTLDETRTAYAAAVAARVLPLLHSLRDHARIARELSLGGERPTTLGAGYWVEMQVEAGGARVWVTVYGDGAAVASGNSSTPLRIPTRDRWLTDDAYQDAVAKYEAARGYMSSGSSVTDTTDAPALAAAVAVEVARLTDADRAMSVWLDAARRAAGETRRALVASV